MLKPLFVLPLFCLFQIFVSNIAFAQSADSVGRPKTAYATVENNFNQALGPQAWLYNGREYNFYPPEMKGNAYFMDIADWRTGSVFYDGFLYNDVNMLYDLYKDEVVIQLYKSFLKISLLSERVKSFDLMGHHFVYIKNDPSNTNSLKTGFYDELYGGKIEVLARRDKSIQTETGFSGSIDSYFLPATDYYLYKNGTYYTVSSESSFLDVLKDRKKDLKQFIRGNKLKFNKLQREQAMAKVAAAYDHLTN